MAYRNDGPFTGTAHGTVSPLRFVKLTGSGWDECDAGDVPDGISDDMGAAAGEKFSVYPLNGSVHKLTAAAAIAAGAVIYVAAGGRASVTVAGDPVGKCVTAATAANGVISAIVNHP